MFLCHRGEALRGSARLLEESEKPNESKKVCRKGEGDYLSQTESGNVMLHFLPGDAKRSSEGGEARKSMKNSFLAFFFLGLLFASVLSVLTACVYMYIRFYEV